jgi:hypothetical protein
MLMVAIVNKFRKRERLKVLDFQVLDQEDC